MGVMITVCLSGMEDGRASSTLERQEKGLLIPPVFGPGFKQPIKT